MLDWLTPPFFNFTKIDKKGGLAFMPVKQLQYLAQTVVLHARNLIDYPMRFDVNCNQYFHLSFD
jgi:hypothetical protein